MKHKKFLLIALICLIGIGISFLLFSAHRPFKDLEAADITSASVRLSPPDTTIQIVETEELVSYLNEVVIYNKDNSYTEYAGQAVIFTLSLADGSQVEIIAYNPFIIIDGIGYKCKYEPCDCLLYTSPQSGTADQRPAKPGNLRLPCGAGAEPAKSHLQGTRRHHHRELRHNPFPRRQGENDAERNLRGFGERND